MFKYLPDREIAVARHLARRRRDRGSCSSWAKQVIGLYLGQTTVASSFGAAGSVVVFMIWVYYAGLILLFGAEITQAVADQRGARCPPREHARPAPGAGTRSARTA